VTSFWDVIVSTIIHGLRFVKDLLLLGFKHELEAHQWQKVAKGVATEFTLGNGGEEVSLLEQIRNVPPSVDFVEEPPEVCPYCGRSDE